MPLIDFKNKKIVLMGLGLLGGGVGTAQYLAKAGARLLITDLKNRKELKDSLQQLKKFKNIQYVLGQHRKSDFKNADLIIKNPGVPNNSQYLEIAEKNNIPIKSDISLFFLLNQGIIIGVTGSKGKSTTATLIYEIFKQAGKKPILAGNIRISPLLRLRKISKNTPVILELSSWQLNSLKKHRFSPYISVITNIFGEHLNRYKSIKEYINDKKIIFQNQTESDFVVLNRDNPITKKIGKEVVAQRFWFTKKYLSEENGCFVKKRTVVFRQNGKEEIIMELSDIKIPGCHNLENILAAICVAKISSLNNISIQKAIRNFAGLKDRLELIKIYRGIKFYNDTTATHPAATMAALDSFSQKVILIAGGADKKLDFRTLAGKIKNKVKFLILLKGDASVKLLTELNKIKFTKLAMVNSMTVACQTADFMAVPEDIVLLSPGAASFNMFKNEFDRGEQFKQCVLDQK